MRDPRPSWIFPLSDFTELRQPVTLHRLRDLEPTVLQVRDRLAAQHTGPLYFPFAFSVKRPLRTTQGYLVKFPRALVDAIPSAYWPPLLPVRVLR